ncbi:MAG: TIGR02757 family protein [Deltaproteobacteria bacterium]|nr:MAG: TIGR02757 family protein [Deltaproteobacteria bacterium]
MTVRRARRVETLALALERAVADFDAAAALERDPLGVVRPYAPEERPVVAHVTACLAYGAVSQIRRAVGEVLRVLGPSPREAVRSWVPGRFATLRPGFVYRMTRAEDVDALLVALGSQLRRHGTLEAAFGAAADAAGVPACGAGDARAPLTAWVAALRAEMPAGAGRGARYLTPDPATGSAAKRWHLMLRWLVRPEDGMDLGAWTVLRPSQLLLPLDTHTARLVHSLGLSDRRTADYRMAREATDRLLEVDPADPVRFDMPLCHLGMSGSCLHRYAPAICPACPLAGTCRWTVRRRRMSFPPCGNGL